MRHGWQKRGRPPMFRRLFVSVRERDQPWLAPGASDERDADRQPECLTGRDRHTG